MTTNFNPGKALFIKLGEHGKWEEDCIEKSGTLRLGFNAAPHKLCLGRQWDGVEKALKNAGYKKLTDTIRQIRSFYEADQSVLWVTFYGDRMWWCFSKGAVKLLSDGSKTRSVVGQWNDNDLAGQPLYKSQISGKLLQVQRYQGTICAVKSFDYLVNKIRGSARPEVEAAKRSVAELEHNLEVIIHDLTPKDFEILMDLIFRQAGWQRAGILGESEHPFDIELFSPMTGTRYGVQIKSSASLASFEEYKYKFQHTSGFEGFFFVVHTPDSALSVTKSTKAIKLLLPQQVAQLAVKYGLADWIIAKAG